jgi:23S rRNA pseudouridine1911/1915/1917 synthase
VHLAEHGHPVLGDPLYGKSIGDPELRRVSAELGRQALHAALLAFAHPITGELLRFETEPPEDFQRALSALRLG